VLLAVSELCYSILQRAWRLGMSKPGGVYAVKRVERIATEKELELINFLAASPTI
jgi:hypothetical protein